MLSPNFRNKILQLRERCMFNSFEIMYRLISCACGRPSNKMRISCTHWIFSQNPHLLCTNRFNHKPSLFPRDLMRPIRLELLTGNITNWALKLHTQRTLSLTFPDIRHHRKLHYIHCWEQMWRSWTWTAYTAFVMVPVFHPQWDLVGRRGKFEVDGMKLVGFELYVWIGLDLMARNWGRF